MRYLKLVMLWLLGILFVAAGVNHFVRPDFYVKIMPPYLPWHLELVYLSGVAEIVLGVLVLIPKWRSLAAWGLIALLVAVFPANIHMAVSGHIAGVAVDKIAVATCVHCLDVLVHQRETRAKDHLMAVRKISLAFIGSRNAQLLMW
jgi:uncharacterized membrane protein